METATLPVTSGEQTKTSFSIVSRGDWAFSFLPLSSPLGKRHGYSRSHSDRSTDVVGLAFVGHFEVSELERSIKFFEAIDFKVADGPYKWTVDKALNNRVPRQAQNRALQP